MNDTDRGAALLAAANKLENKEVAHLIRKYVQFVVNRDAGPSDRLKEENTKLQAENEMLERDLAEIRAKIAGFDELKSTAVRLQRANEGLRSTNVTLSSKNAELVKKHNELVDLYAAADVKAKGLQKALSEATQAHLEEITALEKRSSTAAI